MWGSLKEKMGLPEGPVHAPLRQLPATPVKTVQVCLNLVVGWVGGWLVEFVWGVNRCCGGICGGECNTMDCCVCVVVHTLTRSHTHPSPTHPFAPQAHPGGVCSLEFERPGHLLATCGADKTVQTWDLNTYAHVTTFQVCVGVWVLGGGEGLCERRGRRGLVLLTLASVSVCVTALY